MKRRALVVEDMPIWQDTVLEILTYAGFDVLVASSREQALNALATNDIQLTIIDPVLDDSNRHNRDGLLVLVDILKLYPHIHMLVMTSSDPKRIRSEVETLSSHVPVLWKDEWDDAHFLDVLRLFFSEKET